MLNHLVLHGRIVKDPTFGDTSAGNRYANFRIAWSEKYKEKETKLFLDCKAFSGTAQFMEKYMNRQGQELIVEGKLNTEEWDAQDGQKRSKIVMVVSTVHFCGKKQDNADVPTEQAAPSGGFTAVETDELPF